MKLLLLLTSLIVSLPLMAANANTDTNTNTNTETDYRNNVQWAKDSISQNQQKSGFKNFDVNTLCADATCRSGVANPEQSRYYSNESALSGDARSEANSNEQSQAVTTSFNKGRPVIDENDPAYRDAIGYQNDAYNISHGISSKYHDCDNGLTCDVTSTARSCTVPTNSPVQCHVTPYLKSSSSIQKSHVFIVSGKPPLTMNLPVQTASVTSLRVSGDFTSFGHPLYLKLTLNGALLGNAPVQRRVGSCNSEGQCPSSINSTFTYQGETSSTLSLDIGTILGTLGIPLILPVGNLSVTIVTTEEKVEIGYTNSCGALIPECQQVSSQCVAGKETRIINGISVTQDCWDEQLTYQCGFTNTCGALADCALQTTTCDIQVNGVCVLNKQQRQCEIQQCRDTGLVCGEDSFALSGDYYDPAATQSTDFNRAAAGLAAIGEAGQNVSDAANINENSAIIFKGDIMRCSNKAAGISNCCKDSGWGNSIGITSCSEEEKALGDAKEDKLTISLGEYCAEKVLGVCIRKKKSYCAFSSKLARIVQEEGKAQLGLNFGSAKNPDCSALTPNQLQLIDMDSMDFSDFYEDLHEGIDMPNTDEIQQRLQQSVGGGS